MTPRPLDDADLADLQALLDDIPAPLEPLDVSAVDGYLVGVLLQPRPLAMTEWWRHVADVDGRALPKDFPGERLQALVLRRHQELDSAIGQRHWFDPWVYEVDEAASPLETVLPWVAGFATAMSLFPGLERIDDPALLEPLAVLYAALDADDLEDADELLAEIETLEPPRDLAEAVEDLVRCSLLIADVTRPRPRPASSPARRPPAPRAGRPPGRRGSRRP